MTETIAIVGASLAGLRAAETLRAEGFGGRIVVIGDEPHEPYDRPPLSKGVAYGRIPAGDTALPRRFTLGEGEVQWRLGVAATGLDIHAKVVRLADGGAVSYDRVLIATGTRARPWPDADEAALDGVLTLRGRDDGADLAARLAAKPRRVLIIGAGFTGSELASACRELGLPVTVVARGAAPMIGALGGPVGERAAELHRANGVDLRCGVSVERLDGDEHDRFCGAALSDGSYVDADVAVVALGAVRNTEWLQDSGLAAGNLGVACDTGCRVFGENMMVRDDVFVAGDVARFPHPLYFHEFLALDHWSNAVDMGWVAGHNMICAPARRRPHIPIPYFWSTQFGVNIKSVGIPAAADEVIVTQGSLDEGRFVATYGRAGRVVAAVSFDQGRYLASYERMIAEAATFPPTMDVTHDADGAASPVPAGFPAKAETWEQATAVLTGHDAAARDVRWVRTGHTHRQGASR